jgi:hypothetical protein
VPAAASSHCILRARDLGMLALVFGLCVCVFITAVPIINLFAWGEGDSGGSVRVGGGG